MQEIPYNPSHPASERMFVGRHLLKRQMISELLNARCFELIGSAGIGKTSLLLAVQRGLLTNSGFPDRAGMPLPIYISCKREEANLAKIILSIIEETERTLRIYRNIVCPPEVVESAKAKAKARQLNAGMRLLLEQAFSSDEFIHQPVLLLDDVHRIHPLKIAYELASVLETEVNQQQLVLALASKKPLAEQLRNDVSPLRALITYQHTLDTLTRADTNTLVDKASDYGWEVEEGCASLLYEVTSGHPYRLHYYLYATLAAERRVSLKGLRELYKPKTEQHLDAMLERRNRDQYPQAHQTPMTLKGQQLERLNDAIRDAFPKRVRLEELLRYKFDKRLDDMALGEDYKEIVFKLISATEAEGWTLDLVAAARESNPGNARLLEFAQTLDLASLEPGLLPHSSLESLLREKNSFLDVEQWRTRLGEIEPRVCRVELTSFGSIKSTGTGFLVSSDIVITNYHVVEPIIDQKIKPEDVILRFDYKRSSDAKVLNAGTIFSLKSGDDWLIDMSPYSTFDINPGTADKLPGLHELDYALLRVEGEPGNQSVGGNNGNPAAPQRGWINASACAYAFQPDSPLFIMQHPEGEPLKLAFDTESVISMNSNGTRVRYRTNTLPGSSGSPCFNLNWELVALHHSGEPKFSPTYNQGIPFTAIMALLEKRGINLISHR